MSTDRNLSEHSADKRALNEALTYWSKLMEKPEWMVTADVLEADRSVYRLRDAQTGGYEGGMVVKTAKTWWFTSPDGVKLRAQKLDMFVIRIL